MFCEEEKKKKLVEPEKTGTVTKNGTNSVQSFSFLE